MCKICSALLDDENATFLFAGALARDEFVFSKASGLYVVNTKDSNQPGKHWVVVYISDGGCNFFDWYGQPPSFLVFK